MIMVWSVTTHTTKGAKLPTSQTICLNRRESEEIFRKNVSSNVRRLLLRRLWLSVKPIW